jgi:hypothetical protein
MPYEVLLLVLWCPTTIRVDVVHMFRAFALVINVMGSWSFIWFCNFPLLLEFAEMLDLQLTEFCELFIDFWHCFGPLSY